MAFQQCLIDSEGMLKKHKEKFRTGLLHSAEDFKKTVSTLMDQFDTNGPFTDGVSIAGAMEFISRMRSELSQLKVNEQNIRKGLNIFKIEQPPSHLIQSMEKVRWEELSPLLKHSFITPLSLSPSPYLSPP